MKFLYLIDRLRISPHCANLSKFIQNYVFFLFAAKYFHPRKWASNGPRLLSAALASQCDLSPDVFSHTLSIGPGKDVSDLKIIYTVLQMLRQFCLFMMYNAYVPEGGNEGGREATPTSFSMFDFYGIKAL